MRVRERERRVGEERWRSIRRGARVYILFDERTIHKRLSPEQAMAGAGAIVVALTRQGLPFYGTWADSGTKGGYVDHVPAVIKSDLKLNKAALIRPPNRVLRSILGRQTTTPYTRAPSLVSARRLRFPKRCRRCFGTVATTHGASNFWCAEVVSYAWVV